MVEKEKMDYSRAQTAAAMALCDANRLVERVRKVQRDLLAIVSELELFLTHGNHGKEATHEAQSWYDTIVAEDNRATQEARDANQVVERLIGGEDSDAAQKEKYCR